MSSQTKILECSATSSEEVSIEAYLEKLLRSVPKMVSQMFLDGRAQFECTEDGLLGWRFSEAVPKRVQREVSKIITHWTAKNTLDVYTEVQ